MIELCSEYLSVRCIWVYVLVMSCKHFRVNPHSMVAWMSSNFLLEPGAKSEGEVTATGLITRITYFLNEYSTIWPNWPNDRTMFWVLFCTVHLTLSSSHVTYAFDSESIIYSCLNVKELLAPSRCEIWRWSNCNWTRNQNHLVLERTLNHLAKLAKWSSCLLSNYLYGPFDCRFFSCHVKASEWIHTV